MPDYFAYGLVFVLGAAIGSFLNVVIHRVPEGQSLFPASRCPKCAAAIKPYHNIPVLGWLLLGGKCASCREPISWRYPAVELLTAIIFVLTYFQLGLTAFLPVGLIFVSVMIALIFIDADHMILPNVITYPLIVLAFAVRVVYPIAFDASLLPGFQAVPGLPLIGYPGWVYGLITAVFGALVGGGSLWLVGEFWKRLRGVDAMGLGDVKMMFGVGALLGWRLSLLTIFTGAFAGALVGIALVLRQKDRNLQMQIPFGIFLGVGSVVALLFGEHLIEWYLGRF